MAVAWVLLFVLPVQAMGAETWKYRFMGGLYAFEAPRGWSMRADEENYTGLAISPTATSLSVIMFTSPNPHVQADELREFLDANLTALFKAVGGGGVREVDENARMGSYDGVLAVFDLEVAGGPGGGLGFAFEANDHAIVVVAQTPDSDKEFLEHLEPIMQSFTIDENLVESWGDELDEVGMKALQDLTEMLGAGS